MGTCFTQVYQKCTQNTPSTVTNVQCRLVKPLFQIRMSCLWLCALLLHSHFGILLFAFILIRFWVETAAKTVKIWGCRGQKCRNGETAFGACLQMAVKKIYRDLGQTKNLECAKVQIKDIGPGRFVQAPKMGEILIGIARAHVYPKRIKMYHKRAQNVPDGRRRDPRIFLK